MHGAMAGPDKLLQVQLTRQPAGMWQGEERQAYISHMLAPTQQLAVPRGMDTWLQDSANA
jgi:hypothetical protein